MPVFQTQAYPDPLIVQFYDPFIGTLYNSRIWTVTGTGSITTLAAIGGRIRVRGNAGASYRFNHGNNGAFSVAGAGTINWYGSMTPATAASGKCEFGFQGVSNPTTHFICWRYEPAVSANFRCVTVAGGAETVTDSGVAGDNADHDFLVMCASGSIQFFLDGILRATNTAAITAEALQPFVNCRGSAAVVSDANVDSANATGARA